MAPVNTHRAVLVLLRDQVVQGIVNVAIVGFVHPEAVSMPQPVEGSINELAVWAKGQLAEVTLSRRVVVLETATVKIRRFLMSSLVELAE